VAEEDNYPIVRKWLESQGYYCGGLIYDKGKPIYFENKGTKRQRIDVAGIKNRGTKSLDAIEIVAVEVRDLPSVQYRDIQDAFAYSQYAHKCYLATTGTIDEEDKHDAHCLGVGLLKISGQKVREVLSPRLNQPIEARMLHFLSVLEVSKCPICNTYFEVFIRKDEKFRSFYKVSRPRYFQVAKDYPKTDMFVKTELSALPASYKTRVYICRLCLEEFFPEKIKSKTEDEL
jgi:hypothetical protein